MRGMFRNRGPAAAVGKDSDAPSGPRTVESRAKDPDRELTTALEVFFIKNRPAVIGAAFILVFLLGIAVSRKLSSPPLVGNAPHGPPAYGRMGAGVPIKSYGTNSTPTSDVVSADNAEEEDDDDVSDNPEDLKGLFTEGNEGDVVEQAKGELMRAAGSVGEDAQKSGWEEERESLHRQMAELSAQLKAEKELREEIQQQQKQAVSAAKARPRQLKPQSRYGGFSVGGGGIGGKGRSSYMRYGGREEEGEEEGAGEEEAGGGGGVAFGGSVLASRLQSGVKGSWGARWASGRGPVKSQYGAGVRTRAAGQSGKAAFLSGGGTADQDPVPVPTLPVGPKDNRQYTFLQAKQWKTTRDHGPSALDKLRAVSAAPQRGRRGARDGSALERLRASEDASMRGSAYRSFTPEAQTFSRDEILGRAKGGDEGGEEDGGGSGAGQGGSGESGAGGGGAGGGGAGGGEPEDIFAGVDTAAMTIAERLQYRLQYHKTKEANVTNVKDLTKELERRIADLSRPRVRRQKSISVQPVAEKNPEQRESDTQYLEELQHGARGMLRNFTGESRGRPALTCGDLSADDVAVGIMHRVGGGGRRRLMAFEGEEEVDSGEEEGGGRGGGGGYNGDVGAVWGGPRAAARRLLGLGGGELRGARRGVSGARRLLGDKVTARRNFGSDGPTFRTTSTGPHNPLRSLTKGPRTTPKTRLQALRNTWLSAIKHSAVLYKTRSTHRLDLVIMLETLKSAYPGKKWYILAHDDSYMFMYNVLCHLANRSQKSKWITGMTHCQGANFKCMSGKVAQDAKDGNKKQNYNPTLGGWINGGAGVVMSGSLVRAMEMKTCKQYYGNPSNWAYGVAASDVVLSCCAMDVKAVRVHSSGFTAGPPGFEECQCKQYGDKRMVCSIPAKAPVSERMSFHHVGPAVVNELYKIETTSKVLGPHYRARARYDVGKVINMYG